MTKKQVENIKLRCPDDKIKWNIFINDLFEKIGSCDKCRYSLSTGKGATHKDCKIGNGVHLNNWYCADFERLKK